MADPEKLKQKATEAFQKGKFVKAAEAYAEYCQLDLKDLQARLRMGDAWSKGGKKDQAIAAYTWAAEGFAKEGFLPRAIAASKLILELDPSHQGVQKMLADLYARKTTPSAASGGSRSLSMKVEARVEVQSTAAGFANRKDAIELDERPAAPAKKPAAAAAKADEPPSPMNRKDAIELPAYEVPGLETGPSSGSASVPMAAYGPSPTRREDAIEIGPEEARRDGPSALRETEIDLDVSVTGSQPSVPLEPIPAPRPSGPDIQVELEVPIEGIEVITETGAAPPQSFELKVDEPLPLPAAPAAVPPASFELKVEDPAPPPAAPQAEPPVEVAATPLVPRVWDLSVEEPPEEVEIVEGTVSEELELVEVAEPELLLPPRAPSLAGLDAAPVLEVRPTLQVLAEPLPVMTEPVVRPTLEVLAEPLPVKAEPIAERVVPPTLEAIAAPLTPAAEVIPAAVPVARPTLEVLSELRAEPAGEQSDSFGKPDAPGEKSGSFTAPPGLKPRRPVSESPAEAAPPPADPVSRIWLPGNFAPPAVAAAAPIAEAAPVAEPVRPPAPQSLTDLERGLQIFSRFDADDFRPSARAAPPPPPPPPPAIAPRAARRTFTELELEGDSLLHAVEAAAAVGVEQRGELAGEASEEAMDLPDDQKLEPGELPKIPLFSDLPPDAFIALFERCPLKRVEPGEIVIQQGSLGDSFYVICGGSVRVFRMDGEQRREIATLEEGAFFGEMALLSGAARTASVEAASEDTQLLEISAPILTDLSHRYPQVATALKKFCRQRLLSNLMSSALLFQPFSRQDRRELVQRFRARDVSKGDVLIKEGHRSDGMYLILSGEVEVRVGPTQVASLKEGDVFGEMSLLTKSNATATVAASKHTSLLRLPREDFDLIIMSHPQVLVLVSELTDARAKQNAAIASHRAPAGDAAPMV